MGSRFQDVVMAGTLAARPGASIDNVGHLYLATDDDGGTLYRSNGSVWVQVAKGVSEAAASILTTKGDLLTRNASAEERQAVGANDLALLADSAQATGIKWGQVPSGGIANGAITTPKVGTRPTARATRNTSQSVPNATNTIISFSGVDYDTNTFWSAGSPSRLTVAVAGKYLLIGNLRWDVNATGRRDIYITKNGAALVGVNQNAVTGTLSATDMSTITLGDFAAGDYAELLGVQNSGGALNLLVSDWTPDLMMIWLGP